MGGGGWVVKGKGRVERCTCKEDGGGGLGEGTVKGNRVCVNADRIKSRE
jgi:hypothetical protein